MQRILYKGNSIGKLTVNLLILTIALGLIANTSVGFFAFAQTATPVAGAVVEASGDNGSGSATSNSQGNYNITNFLGTGNYTLTARATGFIDTNLENVNVVAGSETSNVIINMGVSGGISGRITDAVSNAPIVNAIVEAANQNESTDYGSTVLSASNGNYTITTDLATGRYNVTAYAAGYFTTSISNVLVTAGQLTSNTNIALSRSAIITGTVVDAVSNAPLANVTVSAVSSAGGFGFVATTNTTGIYVPNSNLGTGVYNITTFFAPGHISATVTGFNVTAGNSYTQNFALQRSGIISGRITSSAGIGLADVSVSAFSSTGSMFGSATTNSTGYYRITDGLGTGTYTIFASHAGSFNTTTSISVTAGAETPNVNLQLTATPSGVITGRVTNSTGSPLSDVSVTAIAINGVGSGSAFTESDGTYVISTGLGAGTYNVTVSEIGYVDQTQSNVAVAVNQVTSNINFQLQAAPSGKISGRVQTTGTPIIPEFHTELIMLTIFGAASLIITLKRLRNLNIKANKPL
ncbi:MAG TPA: carboxypeptidase-like regulatory domain-containing protein [Candidatus Sulfotelmatobacter sp.]|nr:carboxypeptidase-like regulatory domain-containing protein [Candidatus Sulfotelmatobacter sp.]